MILTQVMANFSPVYAYNRLGLTNDRCYFIKDAVLRNTHPSHARTAVVHGAI